MKPPIKKNLLDQSLEASGKRAVLASGVVPHALPGDPLWDLWGRVLGRLLHAPEHVALGKRDGRSLRHPERGVREAPLVVVGSGGRAGDPRPHHRISDADPR